MSDKNDDVRVSNVRCTYTATQRASAQTVVDLLDSAYEYEHCYMNYRKKFIAINIAEPIIRNEKLAHDLDTLFAERGYEKIVTGDAMIVRIPKA